MRVSIDIPDEKIPEYIRLAARKLGMQATGLINLSPLESLAVAVLKAALEQHMDLEKLSMDQAFSVIRKQTGTS